MRETFKNELQTLKTLDGRLKNSRQTQDNNQNISISVSPLSSSYKLEHFKYLTKLC